MLDSNPSFLKFEQYIDHVSVPEKFDNSGDQIHELCIIASQELQQRILSVDWNHNFGLDCQEGKAVGKMFGVLVVRAPNDEIGYLAGFSGKIGGRNSYQGFVPPIFDGLEKGSFLEVGMNELTLLNEQIEALESRGTDNGELAILKRKRTNNSNSLQHRIYESYQLLNEAGISKSLMEIFATERNTNPPGGAGDCAGPRLLQYAFQNRMKPLAMTEFFWGHSDDSPQWKHKEFYAPCEHKCEPILKHMLSQDS